MKLPSLQQEEREREKKSKNKCSPGKSFLKREVGEEKKSISKKWSENSRECNTEIRRCRGHIIYRWWADTVWQALRMNDQHTYDLNIELTFQHLEAFNLLGWTDKIKPLEKHEEQREPMGGKKYFFAQSRASIIIPRL
jgi:hypothetical protein